MKTTKTIVSKPNGFTLIELLTVIAIIGILAAILFPVVGKVRESAGETAGRAQFSQWSQAFELFRQEYGFYPDFASTKGNVPTTDEILANGTTEDGSLFYEVLSGRKAGTSSGDRVEAGDPGYDSGNVRAASFYTFGEGELVESASKVEIRDHFGNENFVVLFDRNQDGVIDFGTADTDYDFAANSLPDVESVRTGATFTGIGDNIPTQGVRASVIFYSAGYGKRPLLSWE